MKRPPMGVRLVTFLLFLDALIAAIIGLAGMWVGHPLFFVTYGTMQQANLLGFLFLGAAALEIAVGVGVYRLREWAWTSAIGLSLLGILVSLLWLLASSALGGIVLIGSLLVLYYLSNERKRFTT